MQVCTGHVGAVTCGRFTPDGKLIITGSADASIIIWEPKTGAAVYKWTATDGRFHQEAITCLDVSKDSGMILSGDSSGTTLLLQMSTKKVCYVVK